MKIAYVTTFDIQKPESWPKRHLGLYGAAAKIIQTLKTEDTVVEHLGSLARKRSPITRLKWQFYRNFHQKDFYSWADPIVQRHYARQIKQQLSNSNTDILLCPENVIPIANVKPDRPLVLWTDATLGSLVDFYPYLSNLCAETRRNLMRMEKKALERCSLLIVTSRWAAQSAHQLYNIPLSKIKVIPRGAEQIHQIPSTAIKTAIEQRRHEPCNLLFIGVEWQRKGGDTALSVAQALNDKGLETELHIVGCTPPHDSPEFVKAHGFIDRSTTSGQAKMNQLFQNAHFLIYPTKADAMGMALSEAASFGVPALANNVGGIADIVKTDITGQIFALDSHPNDYCRFVMRYMSDVVNYQSLAYSTFESYQNTMSWLAVGEQARTAFESLLKT